jgi:hypothetical protein
MTRYELLKSETDNAYTEWLIKPRGFGRAVCYLVYRHLRHKLGLMPLCEAEKELEALPRRRFL